MKEVRINLIFIILVFLGAAIIGRLFYIQVRQGEFYLALSRGQQGFFDEIVGPRGDIFVLEKDGQVSVLATNILANYVYVSPPKVKDIQDTAQKLSDILNLPKDELINKISDRDNLYVPIKKRLTQKEIEAIKEFNLPGVYLQNYEVRYYPQDEFAAHILGFVSGENKGQYGIEGYYDDLLKGEAKLVNKNNGFSNSLKDISENLALFFKENVIKNTNSITRGASLILTINPDIQFFAKELLEKYQDELGFKSGTVIVADPMSGKILALVNYPSFNPNQYYLQKDFSIFQNSAIQKLYEPGSAFKPFTIAAALNENKITPDTTYVDEGKVKIGGYVIYNYGRRVWGERTMTEVLERSINTGAIFAEKKMGHDLFLEYVKKFGFLEPTGIDLQGEIFSLNAPLQQGREINFATASFGQGIEMTPIQLITAFASLINGGYLLQPYVVDKIITSEGDVIETEKKIKRRVISDETSSKISAMLVNVVENGSGKLARIPGYYIGGKTGTAQVAWSSLGIKKAGYSNETIQTFIGFAPAFNPRFIILVKLDNPKTRTAEYSAAPLFKDLAKYILDYWEIPPDYIVEQ